MNICNGLSKPRATKTPTEGVTSTIQTTEDMPKTTEQKKTKKSQQQYKNEPISNSHVQKVHLREGLQKAGKRGKAKFD